MKKRIIQLFLFLVLTLSVVSCGKIKIIDDEIKDETVSISFNETEVLMLVGETKPLPADVVIGEYVYNFKLTYSVSNDNASVDTDGNVTALKEGYVTLTATGNDENKTSASIEIEILTKPLEVYNITYNLDGGVNPEDAVTSFNERQTVTLPTPTKEGYKFLGWYEGEELVTETVEKRNYEVTAKWVELQEFTVTFKVDGEVFEEVTYIEGETSITEPAVPAKPGHTGKWEEYTLNDTDLVVNAEYTKNKYTVTWVVDGEPVKTEEVEYEAMPTAPANPTKDATAQYTYTFKGWTPEVVAVTGEATYTAEFDATVNKYTVTWVVEGVTVKEEQVEYGTVPTQPTTPTKEATAQYTYTFKGWDNEVVAVTGEATYTAEFNATSNKYTVTFDSKDGTQVAAQEVTYNDVATKPADPTKEGYKFVEWQLNGAAYDFATKVIGNITLDAVWVKVVATNVTTGETYATLAEALADAEENNKISVIAGSYEGTTLSVAGLTLVGPNEGKNPNTTERLEEAVFTTDLTIAADNVTLDGIKLTGAARIVGSASTAISNLTINNVLVSETTAFNDKGTTAPLYFIPSSSSVNYTNTTISNMRIEEAAGRVMVMYGDMINGLTVENSEFYGTSHATDSGTFNDGFKIKVTTTKEYSIKGEVKFIGNKFNDYQQYTIWLGNYGSGNYIIANNTFTNCALNTGYNNGCITFATPTNATNVTINVTHNTTNNTGILARLGIAGLDATTLTANVNYNKIYGCLNTYFVSDHGTGSGDYINAKNNYYDVTPTDANFNGVSEWAPVYENAEDVPTYPNVPTYTVSYDSVNGSAVTSETLERGEKATAPTDPTREGYTFLGWLLNGSAYDFDSYVTGDITLVADWQDNSIVIDYTIEYTLDGGTNQEGAVTTYQVYTTVTLPTPTKEGYVFQGWKVGDTTTVITDGKLPSAGDYSLTAQWAAIVATNENTGVGYATIAEAISAASKNDVIAVKAGTYDEELTIDQSITLKGPHAGVKGTDPLRGTGEATITKLFTISAESVTINGINFNGSGNIVVAGNNATITNIRMTVASLKNSGNNRKGCIVELSTTTTPISGLTISNSYIYTTSTGDFNGLMSFNNVSNLTILGNYMASANTSSCTMEGLTIYNISGTFNFIDNEYYYPTEGYGYSSYTGPLRVGVSSNSAVTNIIGNIFGGSPDGTLSTSYLSFTKAPSGIVTIRGNLFKDFDNLFYFNSSGTYNVEYNIFDNDTQYVIAGTLPNGLTVNNNCYLNSDSQGTDANLYTKADNVFVNAYKAYCTTDTNVDDNEWKYFESYLTEYTITYNLDGGLYEGATTIANTTYTDVADATLPTAKPTKDGYTFLGWYDSSNNLVESITEYADYSLIAKWHDNSAPMEYTVTYDTVGGNAISNDTFTDYTTVVLPTPDARVGFEFDGWYDGETKVTALSENKDYNLVAKWNRTAPTTLEVGTGKSYATIKDALAIAIENDIIKVYEGTYADDLTISVANIKLVDATFENVKATADRTGGAILEGLVTVSANNVTINGLILEGSAAIVLGAVENIVIDNVYSTSKGNVAYSSSYYSVVYSTSSTAVSDVNISNSYFYYETNYYSPVYFTNVNNLTVNNNKFSNAGSCTTGVVAVKADTIGGNLYITENEINLSTGNRSLDFGLTANNCTSDSEIWIKDNIISGTKTATIRLNRLPSGVTAHIVNNTIVKSTSNNFDFLNCAGTINVKYNYFNNTQSYGLSKNGSSTGCTLYIDKNYYDGDVTPTGVYLDDSNEWGITSDLEREIAYYSDINYNPETAYEITYDAGDGAVSSTTQAAAIGYDITLLTPTREGYTFLGWTKEVESTDYLTVLNESTLPTNSAITLYAQWQLGEPEAQGIQLSEADVTALTAIYSDNSKTATILVNPTLENPSGNYVLSGDGLSSGYTDVEYVYGTTLFSNISSALAVAEANNIIYVFGGTYAEDFTLDKAGLVFAGPNYNIAGNGTRTISEADITGKITISASTIINGIKMSGGTSNDTTAPISLSGTIDGVTIKNCYLKQLYGVLSNAAGSTPQYAVGRRAVISQLSGATTNNLVIIDNYINPQTYNGGIYLRMVLAMNSGVNVTVGNNEIATVTTVAYLASGVTGNYYFYGNTSGVTNEATGGTEVITTAPTA